MAGRKAVKLKNKEFELDFDNQIKLLKTLVYLSRFGTEYEFYRMLDMYYLLYGDPSAEEPIGVIEA